MTILTAGACGYIITYPGNAKPAIVGTAAGTLVTGAKLFLQADAVKMALTAAVGTGTTSGAVVGAVATKTAASAATGALVGGMCAGGVGSMMAGGIAVATGTLSSSLGLLTVGASSSAKGSHATYDCWKPVVRDISEEPSEGMLLKDLVCHPHVSNVTIKQSACLPHIVLENSWNEKFEINYIILKDSDKMFCHASPTRE